MATTDYTNIETPYDPSTLTRNENSSVLSVSEGDNSGNNSNDTPTDGSSANNSTSSSNGSVEQTSIKSGSSLSDLWISNFIKSKNWSPKKIGFYIDGQTGYAEFSNVYVSGNIKALTGSVGGFDLGADYVRDTNNTFGLASTVTGGNDVRLWAGASYENRDTAPFRVYEDGSIAGTGLTITKIDLPDETTADSFHVDVDGNTWWGANVATGYAGAPANILKDGSAKFTSGTIAGCVISSTSIGTSDFVSGPLGSGWNISNTGVAEFQNVSIRGVIKTSVFEKDTISAVNGALLVTKGDVLDVDMTSLDASTLIITGESSFVNDEILRIKDGVNDEWLIVTDASGAPTYIVTRDLSGLYAADSNPEWKKGTSVVSMGVGTGTKTGFISIDSSSANSPFIDIYGRNSNTYNDVNLHGRFGWLKGITDTDVGLATTDVWGLYTDNAYLKGTIVATSGKFGSTTNYWNVSSSGLTAVSTNADIFINYGKTDFDNTQAGFILGYDYSDSVSKFYIGNTTDYLNWNGSALLMKGTITATSGRIGGTEISSTALTGGIIQTDTSGDRLVLTESSWISTGNPAIDAYNGSQIVGAYRPQINTAGTGLRMEAYDYTNDKLHNPVAEIGVIYSEDIGELGGEYMESYLEITSPGGRDSLNLIYDEDNNQLNYLDFNCRVGSPFHPVITNFFDIGSNTYRWDDAYIREVHYVTLTSMSDETLKKDIVDIDIGLTEILSLKPRTFKWKENNIQDVGFIAQEMQSILPDFVRPTTEKETKEERRARNPKLNDRYREIVLIKPDGEPLWSIDYNKLFPVMIKAIQELNDKITDLQSQIDAMK